MDKKGYKLDRPPTRFQDPRTSNPLNKATCIIALLSITFHRD